MRWIAFLLFAGVALSQNHYTDYVLCRLFQEKDPNRAKEHCTRALERAPTPTLYMDTVRLETQLKQTERALKIATDFKARYPDLPQPYLILHQLYTMQNQKDRALKVLEEGHAKNPSSKELALSLTEEYIKARDTVKAKNLLLNLAQISPDSPLPYFMLARIALMEGRQQEAIEFLEKSLRINPTFPASVITLGNLYEQRGEHGRAEALYRGILSHDPENQTALERLGNLYTLTGKHQQAKEVYRRLTELYPEVNYFYLYSLSLIRAGDTAEAKNLLEKLYAENPANPDVAYTYAMLLETLRETDRALEIYTDLQKRLGNHPRIVERLASVYLQKKDYRRAEDLLRSGLSTEPNNFQLNLLMGHLLSEQDHHQEALTYADRAVQINPRDYRGYFLRAIIHDRAGRVVPAEKDLRKALELNPEDPELLNHLGYSLLLWYESARLEEAEALIKRALSKDPENPAYIDSMAWVLYYKGDYKGAYEMLRRALEKEKDDPVLYEHMGDVLSKLGKEKEAQDYYQRAYKLLLSGKKGEPNQKERLENKLKVR